VIWEFDQIKILWENAFLHQFLKIVWSIILVNINSHGIFLTTLYK